MALKSWISTPKSKLYVLGTGLTWCIGRADVFDANTQCSGMTYRHEKKKSLIIFLKKLTDYNHRQWEYESIKWDTQQRIGLTCSISLMTLCLMLISSKTASITMSAFWKFYNKWKIHISLHMVLVEIQLILQQAFKGMERESVVTVWY